MGGLILNTISIFLTKGMSDELQAHEKIVLLSNMAASFLYIRQLVSTHTDWENKQFEFHRMKDYVLAASKEI